MTLVAALLPNATDRSALDRAVAPHRVAWASDWRELMRCVKREPAIAAIADLHAEPGKDGVLRVYRFAQRFPNTPILAWGDLDGRDLFRLGKAGVTDILAAPDAGNAELVAELIREVTADSLSDTLDRRLSERLAAAGRRITTAAVEGIPDAIQVPDLARELGMSVSTLERRCEACGLTTPGRVLLWLRVIYGLRWLQEPGRSVESVAGQLGYSSGAAFRRAIKATMGENATPLRNSDGLQTAIEGFLQECPGAPDGCEESD